MQDPLQEGEICIDESGHDNEDVEDVKHAASPAQLSADVIERHRVDHTPDRSWCKC